MNWLKEFENEIMGGAMPRFSPKMMNEMDLFQKGLKSFFDAANDANGYLKENVPDEEWNKLETEMWNNMGLQEIEKVKNERLIASRFASLYTHLAKATEAEVVNFARMRLLGFSRFLRNSWADFVKNSNDKRRKDRELLDNHLPPPVKQ